MGKNSKRSKVSCHYLINRRGNIFKLVKEENVAWHAGKSMWGKYKNLNKNSIGIELEGNEIDPYTDEQYISLIKVTRELINFYICDLSYS